MKHISFILPFMSNAVLHKPNPLTEPVVHVGIVGGHTISFSLNGPYTLNGTPMTGDLEATVAHGLIHLNGEAYTCLLFSPAGEESSFSLHDVTIGVNFHWERKETQTFRGALKLIADKGKLWAVNIIQVEQYLESVISSEMSATSNLPLLMAHAVISRSWLLAQIHGDPAKAANVSVSASQIAPSRVAEAATKRIIKWYDHTNHTLFDVCADDHCQRYQGITKATSPHVKEAIDRTHGQILVFNGEICDTRFSKCCGGALEEYQYCWDDRPKPYLRALGDTPSEKIPDLTNEDNARKWILSSPESFCNTQDKRILGQVLNGYDQETTDFYRWHVVYTQQELSALIRKKLDMDLGDILQIIPLKRGKSGRIYELEIIGTRQSVIVGKELEIRRILSESHLLSSAFVVTTVSGSLRDGKTIPSGFRLDGAGWGHGVGLCQIGAAVMGDKGYAYDDILRHYYPNTKIETAW